MILKDLQRGLATDQANILRGRVVSVSQGTARVRLPDGRVVRAAGGTGYTSGTRVQVQTDGSSFAISGTAPLAATDGEIIVQV